MQRVALLNGENINQDYDLWKILKTLINPWVVEGLQVLTNQVSIWYAFISVTRNWETFPVLFQNSSILTIDTSWTKKVYIELNQSKIDDGISNLENWTWIWEIKTWSTYPTTNPYISLAEISSWVITDTRSFISLKWIKRKWLWNSKILYTDSSWNESELLIGSDWTVLSVNWWALSFSNIWLEQYIAWEAISWAWKPLRFWVVWADNIVQSTWTDTSLANRIGYNTTYVGSWQSFTAPTWFNSSVITSISLKLSKWWSPTWNLTLKIYSNTSWTLLATSTNTISSSTLPSSPSWSDFIFNFNNISLSAWTYYLALETDAGNSTTNFVIWMSSTTDVYSGWTSYYISIWNVWNATATTDKVFTINTSEDIAKVYLTNAWNANKLWIIWYSAESASLWALIKINSYWNNNYQSGLTPQTDYYLWNTPWSISSTPWTYKRFAWTAISATQIAIPSAKVNPKEDIFWNKISLSTWVNYLATTSWIVTAITTNTSSPNTQTLDWYTDSTTTPTTLVTTAMYTSWASKVWICFPVKKWDYYRIDWAFSTWWTQTANITFTPNF